MSVNKPSVLNLEKEFAKISLHEIAERMGHPLPAKDSGELRIQCFNCEKESSYGALKINLDNPSNLFNGFCCGVKGNRFTLMYVWKYGILPPGGSVRGDDYKEMLALHREFTGDAESVPSLQAIPKQVQETRDAVTETLVNIPLKDSEKEAARNLESLHTELITDPAKMKPAASDYVLSREWMTPEAMLRWRIGWIQANGRSMFRSNFLVYTHHDRDGNVISYSGRNLHFEEKWTKWKRDGSPENKKPMKHKYVSGYHRGIEIYGAHELEKPELEQSLALYGVAMVEGMNDTARLMEANVPTGGICSNKATQQQIADFVDLARRKTHGRIWLMPDKDREGLNGFKEILWKLQEHEGIDARPGWPKSLERVSEPENLTNAQIKEALLPLFARSEER